MLHKREVIGIFLSIAVMALVLAFFRFQGTEFASLPSFDGANEAAVVVAGSEDVSQSEAVRAALDDAISVRGSLEKLVIDDVVIGSGTEVSEGDTVVVHYVGSTQDGVQFDSSYARGEAFSFTVGAGRVIEGWETGIVGMHEGGKRILVVPPAMAYGNAQVGPIRPNATLVFMIELLEVE